MSNESWRITAREIDASNTVRPETNNIGAVVLVADKGPETPVKIERGNKNRILNMFGTPTSSKPQIYEALKYIEEAPCWISAPNRSGEYGGVYITKTGTEPFSGGFTAKGSTDFDTIAVTETMGTGDGSTNTFTLTLDDYEHYNNQTIRIKVDGTDVVGQSVSNAATEIITTTPDIGNGTYVRATGLVTFTFNSAPANAAVVSAYYTVDRSDDVYAILFNKNPQTDDLGVIVELTDSTNKLFEVSVAKKDSDGNYALISGFPKTVSMTSGAKDGFGQNVFIEDVFENDDYVTAEVNTALTVTTFQVTTAQNENVGIGNGSSVNYTKTLTYASTYVNQSIDITLAGTTINVTASDANPEVLTTTPNVGSGTYNRTTGVLDFTFSSAPAEDVIINTTYSSLEPIDAAYVDMAGGDRGEAVTGSDLVRGWAYFQDSNTYPADIFFDVSANQNIPASFNALRNTYQKYKHYILPLPQSTASAANTTKTGYGIADRGISYYWNRFKISNEYNDDSIWTPATGAIAKKHAQMVDVFNGLAPAWIDENNHGGLLDISVQEQAYDPDEDTLKQLDKWHINPIHNDIVYGPMIKSQRTSYATESDYSYIGHSRTADYIISNIVNLVLPYQLVKLNDTFHRSQVKANSEIIISPLAGDPYNLLRDFLVKCDEENNNDTILAQRKFVLQVWVKFTPFSETIDFFFINTAQGAEVGGSGV